eukprot:6270749-Amphidinium_carterae.2
MHKQSDNEKLNYEVRTSGSSTSIYQNQYFDNEKHSNYNFHKRIEYAMGDFLNLYLRKRPNNFKQQADQLGQPQYLVIVHMTMECLRDLSEDLKATHGRKADWHTRRNVDMQFQINGDKNGRRTVRPINVGSYMTYDIQADMHTNMILDKQA